MKNTHRKHTLIGDADSHLARIVPSPSNRAPITYTAGRRLSIMVLVRLSSSLTLAN